MPIPPPLPGVARVIVVDPGRVDPAALDWLTPGERDLARRFRFEKDARHWSACRAALRGVLGEVLGAAPARLGFGLGEFGKPRLDPPRDALHFNLSHCHDLALVGLCGEGEVGIDVEPAGRADSLLGCEDAFCHPEEMKRLPAGSPDRARRLLEIWTAKEALLKAIGTGMSLAPRTIHVADDETGRGDERLRGIRLHRIDDLTDGHHAACLALPVVVRTFTLHHWPD
jgi:4'-phosphopantetheinyl transferase